MQCVGEQCGDAKAAGSWFRVPRLDFCWLVTGLDSKTAPDLCAAVEAVAVKWRVWVFWGLAGVLLFLSIAQYYLAVVEYCTWCENVLQDDRFAATLKGLMAQSEPSRAYVPWIPPGLDWQAVLARAVDRRPAVGASPLHESSSEGPAGHSHSPRSRGTPRSQRSLAAMMAQVTRDLSPRCEDGAQTRTHSGARSSTAGFLELKRSMEQAQATRGGGSQPSQKGVREAGGGLGAQGEETAGGPGPQSPAPPAPLTRQQRRKEEKEAKKAGKKGLKPAGAKAAGVTEAGVDAAPALPLPGARRMIAILHQCKRPSLSHTFIGALALLPMRAVSSGAWAAKFVWKYCWLARPYDFHDEAWLTRRALGLTVEFWRGMTLHEQMQLVQMRLWDPDNLGQLTEHLDVLKNDVGLEDAFEPLL